MKQEQTEQKWPSKAELRHALASSEIEPLFQQKAEFIAWLRNLVPDKYRKMNETSECFSANRDFYPLLGIGFPEKRNNLALINTEMVTRLQHALGNVDIPCERCIREINAAVHYQMEHHHEPFTPSAHKLADLDLRARRLEHKQEARGYKSDGLFLLQTKTPLMGGDPSMHETHLIFYDEYSLRHAKQIFLSRIAGNPELVKELGTLVDFADSQVYSFPRVSHRYHSISSSQYIQRQKGHLDTVVELVSRKLQ